MKGIYKGYRGEGRKEGRGPVTMVPERKSGRRWFDATDVGLSPSAANVEMRWYVP